MEQWKIDLGKKAITAGLIKDPQWLQRLDEPMPVWAVLEIVLLVIDKLDPPYQSYD
jgi:hypothetical protein